MVLGVVYGRTNQGDPVIRHCFPHSFALDTAIVIFGFDRLVKHVDHVEGYFEATYKKALICYPLVYESVASKLY